MKNFKKILLRIITILTLIVFLTSVSFFTYNKKITKGAIFETIGFGTGALGALVAAYFATAGITFSGSSDTDGNFLGNYVSNWVKNSSSYASNPYFDSNGDFIGSSDDLSIVQNNDSDIVSLIFGKEFAAWLEVLKQSFVSDHSLTTGSSIPIFSENSIDLHVSSSSGPLVSKPTFELNQSYELSSFASICEDYGSDSVTLYSSSGYYFTYTRDFAGAPRVNTSLYIFDSSDNLVYSNTGRISNLYGTNYTSYLQNGLSILVTSGDSLYVSLIMPSVNNQLSTIQLYGSVTFGSYAQYFTSDISDISLDGTLTDGYSDFEDAINQDLTNADEEEVAVVGVGEFPETLDVNDILDGILDKIIAGTLNPTYEGTWENMGEAEEEKEGERPFVPEVPEGWVVVDGLEDFFPFCIPWDLYNIIAVLNVPAEAPRFEYEISFGNEDFEKEKVVIDLSPFNTVARIFRIMMAVGFVVFLIIKTRDLIRG